jgi:hypothetical protein
LTQEGYRLWDNDYKPEFGGREIFRNEAYRRVETSWNALTSPKLGVSKTKVFDTIVALSSGIRCFTCVKREPSVILYPRGFPSSVRDTV